MVWVRPLKRILCALDGEIVPFDLAQGGDDGHGLGSGDLTEGHRIMSPGAFAVGNFDEYKNALTTRHVVLEADDRAALIREGISILVAKLGLEVVPDEALITEVAGLVEWPVPLLGRIDDAFMDLPPEVMRTTMRVNQRYFALRKPDGTAAPRFALVANIAAPDGGAAIVAGNERVLRARLAAAKLRFVRATHDGKNLYGSVTAADVVEALAASVLRKLGLKEKGVRMPGDGVFKTVGTHEVQIEARAGLWCALRVEVEST
jgi:glycyl-tRNA synthetase beta chain